jgi:peptidoglycan/xylan/chitin deacetylase (PgdA/CDA1 family)
MGRGGRDATPAEALREIRPQDKLVHSWPLDRDLPRPGADGRRSRHEIGAHGYLHENPIGITATQEEEVLARSSELAEKLSGQAPRGYVAPWWEM